MSVVQFSCFALCGLLFSIRWCWPRWHKLCTVPNMHQAAYLLTAHALPSIETQSSLVKHVLRRNLTTYWVEQSPKWQVLCGVFEMQWSVLSKVVRNTTCDLATGSWASKDHSCIYLARSSCMIPQKTYCSTNFAVVLGYRDFHWHLCWLWLRGVTHTHSVFLLAVYGTV